MIRNKFWRLTIVILLILWSLYETYPPTTGDLIAQFQKQARVIPGDTTISNIVFTARELEKTVPNKQYGNLLEAVGTNDIAGFFPFNAAGQPNPTTYILNRLQREVAGRIKLGLDLRGGTSFLMELDTSVLSTNDTAGAVSQAVEVIRKRVDRFGVAEPVILPQGDNRILVQLPGLSEDDRNRAVSNLQKTAFLEFRLAHERTDQLVQTGEIPPGYELLKRREHTAQGERLEQVVVKRKGEPGLTGNIIKKAAAMRGNMGELEIDFELTPAGAERFAEVTKENKGRRLAIVLDGQLYSAPNINEPILTGSGRITGNFDIGSARELAGVMENPLKAPLRLLSSKNVDPTLGKDSIRSGMTASAIGVILVVLFMLVYYRVAGVIANIALLTNIVILLGVMCAIGATFTLPGIAGIVLTIGMAVDANVLIYERIREEKEKGKSLRGAIAAGYDRAFSTIFDSNLTTLIASVILIFMGTASVKGFGVTLTIGVTASLFTALVVTRLIFDWLLAKNLIKDVKMMHLVRTSKLDFLKWAKPMAIISVSVMLIGLGFGVYKGNRIYGVEFTGGDTIQLSVNQSHLVDTAKLRAAVDELKVGESMISYQSDLGSGVKALQLTLRGSESAGGENISDIDKLVVGKLQTTFPEAEFMVKSMDKVGPLVGKEIRNSAITSVLLALFGILVYVAFRYEFSFAVAAVVAILHDILITAGIYFMTPRELNSTVIAALLTIVGFSINDTIVIFDRIREDLRLGVRGSFREVINQALNQTLSRTLITTGTVVLATLALYIFGGGPVNDFAFTFLVGSIVGTYSSIYVASALVLWWHKGQRPALGSAPVVSSRGGATAAAKA